MNLDRIVFKKGGRTRIALFGLLLLMSITACKARASNPALNFAPVPDVAPQNSYADVVAKAAPAVITIRADRRVRQAQQFPFMDDPFFRGLFGNRGQQQPQERLQQALGSGVVVSVNPFRRSSTWPLPNTIHGAPVTVHVTSPTRRLSSLIVRVLEMTPLFALAVICIAHRDELLPLVASGGMAAFSFAWKDPPLPASTIAGVICAFAVLGAGPYLLEIAACLRVSRDSGKGGTAERRRAP